MIVLAAVTLPLAGSVSAGSIGACLTSGVGSYHSGADELIRANVTGIYATLEVGGSGYFGPCSPNDNQGTNASSANIGIQYGNAWLEAGLIICNHTDNGAWPANACNGGRRFFIEQHGQAFWDYNFWTYYNPSPGIDFPVKIVYNGNTHYYDIYFNNTLTGTVNMRSGLVPAQANGYYWQVETKDVGDGLGSLTTATNVGSMESYYDGAWRYHTISGSSCPVLASGQHYCVPNGSVGFYAYTNN